MDARGYGEIIRREAEQSAKQRAIVDAAVDILDTAVWSLLARDVRAGVVCGCRNCLSRAVATSAWSRDMMADAIIPND